MTAQDVARHEGVDVSTVRAWIRMGKLEANRLPTGRHNSVIRIDLEQYDRFRRREKENNR